MKIIPSGLLLLFLLLSQLSVSELLSLSDLDPFPIQTASVRRLTLYLQRNSQGLFYGPLRLGTNKHSLQFVINTASDVLWFPSQQCTDCSKWRRYNTQSSKVFILTSTEPRYVGDSSAGVWGYPCEDEVWVSTVLNMQKVSCLSVYRQQNVQIISADGYLGLGRNGTGHSFLGELVNQNIVGDKILGLRLRKLEDSMVIFGPFDSSVLSQQQQDSEIVVPLILGSNTYRVRVTGSYYGQQLLGDRVETAIIHSGLGYLKAPSDELSNLVKYIEAQYGTVRECSGRFCLDCSALNRTDALAVTVVDFNLYVPFSDIWEESGGTCSLKIVANDEKIWELGTPFLEHYVTVINEDSQTVTFYGDQIEYVSKPTDYTKWIIVGVVVLCVLVAGGVLIGCCLRMRRKRKEKEIERTNETQSSYAEYFRPSSEGFVTELKVRRETDVTSL